MRVAEQQDKEVGGQRDHEEPGGGDDCDKDGDCCGGQGQGEIAVGIEGLVGENDEEGGQGEVHAFDLRRDDLTEQSAENAGDDPENLADDLHGEDAGAGKGRAGGGGREEMTA